MPLYTNAMASPAKTIVVDGMTLTLVVERKRVKNVNARLRASTLSVSAPQRMADDVLDAAIHTLARKLVRRVRAREANSVEDAHLIAKRIADRFHKPPQVQRVIFVTTQVRRWGSYSAATQTIRLHAALRLMPRWVLEAVIAHELAHMFHLDHSPAFWSLAREVCPDTDRARAFLDGVSWLAASWQQLPAVERALLAEASSCVDAPE